MMGSTASTTSARKPKREDDPLLEPGIIVPEDEGHIPGISFRRNADGTRTLFPKTLVVFYRGWGMESLEAKLSKEEVDLINCALNGKDERVQEAITAYSTRWPTEKPLSLERAQASALAKLYNDPSTDEFLFLAERSLKSTETVGVLRLDMNTRHKNICTAECYPSRTSIDGQATIDLCRAKTPLALRQMLAKVHDFFTKTATFHMAVDRAGNESKSCHVGCEYQLVLKMKDDVEKKQEGLSSGDSSDEWIYPTKAMLEEWGYEPKGIKYCNTPLDETRLIICSLRG